MGHIQAAFLLFSLVPASALADSAPDEAWERPLPAAVVLNPEASGVASPIQLDWLMLHARQHEL